MNNKKWFWFAVGYQTGLHMWFPSVYTDRNINPQELFGIITAVAFLLIIGFIYLLVRPYRESKKLKVDLKEVTGTR